MAQPDPESITLFCEMTEADRARAAAEVDHVGCRRLWAAAVLAQWDLVFKPKRSDRPHDRDAARSWFGSRDFFAACDLAGIDGHGVLRRFRSELSRTGGDGAPVPPAADPARHDRAFARRRAIKAMIDAGADMTARALAGAYGVSQQAIAEDLRVIRAGKVAG